MIWSSAAIADLQRSVRAGLTGGEIAERLGCSRGAVMGKLHRLGLKLNEGRGLADRMRQPRIVEKRAGSVWTPEKIGHLKKLTGTRGMGVQAIANNLEFSFDQVAGKLRQLGWRSNGRRGRPRRDKSNSKEQLAGNREALNP